jgi:4-hydroxy-2-oxoheptanedioate aldolase
MLEDLLAGRRELAGELATYIHERNDSQLLIVNIESVAAIEALDEILAVPQLDAVLIGPHDLSCSLGVPEQYQHPLFVEAVRTIVMKARAKNIGAGVHNLPTLEQERYWNQAGMNLILHLSDLMLFRQGLARNLRTLRGGEGERPESQIIV